MATTSSYGQMSFWEKLDLIPAIFYIIGSVIYDAVQAPFRGERAATSFKRHVSLAMIRAICTRLSPAQLQFCNPPAGDVYQSFVKEKGLDPQSITLPDGSTKAYWIGNNMAKRVIIWFPGGGYAIAASKGHFEFASELQEMFREEQESVAVIVLSYTLTPEAQYPRQLHQGVELLRYVTTTLGKDPSDIVLAGDSAGGNLALAVLSHISHPHEAVPPLELSRRLRGVLLLSPWVSSDTTSSSFATNRYKDTLVPSVLDRWADAFVGSARPDNYNQPCRAPPEWWKDLQTEEMIVVAGADEVLVDSIRDLGRKIESTYSTISIVTVQNGYHCEPMIRYGLGLKESQEDEQSRLIKAWARKMFGLAGKAARAT